MEYSADTKILPVNSEHPEPDLIHTAAATIRSGGLVAFPTETVYGLGANALDAAAINRIYRAKRRPANDPIIAHIYDVSQLDTLAVQIPDAARRLAEVFFPGPLTLVLKRAPHVPSNIAAGLDTVAVRMPVHPVARALLKAADLPIAAPSANIFTRPSATTAAHVLEDLVGRVDVVLDGGAASIGLESTVIDMTQVIPVVLRPGGVVVDDLRPIVPNVILEPKHMLDHQPSVAPGQLTKHYSPRADVLLFDGNTERVIDAMCERAGQLIQENKRVGILAADEEAERFTALGARIISMGARSDLAQIGRVLFGAMRALDAQGVDAILVHGFGQEGLGAAIWDRLLRAAEGKVIQVK